MNPKDLPLAQDPRWKRIYGRDWTCPNCRAIHNGLFDMACAKPDAWPGPEDGKQPNSAVLDSTHFLSEDFCVLNDEHFFVRAVLEIPVLGAPAGVRFAYGVWSTLSRKNFEIYENRFNTGDYDGEGPWFGWLSNALANYPNTFNLKCQVHPRSGRQRPWIELESTDHPLAVEQREGISLDRLLEIYAFFGHDIRPALFD
ncbi:MAG TPA: DUF2199 domain-containing protein [Rhizomicrobium sp.]|jgi:hypothetical protein|nr:DUF2199 domain-containing protein [Rhizomicrobium sp.]